MSRTPLLDSINHPSDLRKIRSEQLTELCRELRYDLIENVTQTGGHLGAGLGVIELTVALHFIFDTPKDKLIWDVGHQSYPHKILTKRRCLMASLRSEGGISGFTKRSESDYDCFGAGHSSTSISAGLGMAIARDLKEQDYNVVCVIGDGAMSAGMAYEAMNNAGNLNSRLIVILNDNDMSIAPPTGSMSSYLARLVSGKTYLSIREAAKQLTKRLPKLYSTANQMEEYARGLWTGGTLFEELGFYYVGPINGHEMGHLLPVLQNVKNARQGPILIHVVTEKGKGYKPAELAIDKLHAINKPAVKKDKRVESYTNIFVNTLIEEAKKDEQIVAINAAMPSGTGLDKFSNIFPKRCFDVGIAEQHAVTFAAGLACEGLKPFVAIYSTFLQRAYDQLVHDVAIQKLPVRFAIDRCGLVGEDGATHAGILDNGYLCCVPNFVVMAAGDEAELARMVVTASKYDDGPISFRYPRGAATGIELSGNPQMLEIGKARYIQQGNMLAILNFGSRLKDCKWACSQLEKENKVVTLVDARFAKPLDTIILEEVFNNHSHVLVIEDAVFGGFSARVLEYSSIHHAKFNRLPIIKCLNLLDEFPVQGSMEKLYQSSPLGQKEILRIAQEYLRT